MMAKEEQGKYLGRIEESQVNQRIGKGKIMTHISLFTGIGGFDIGFANAGIQTRVMIEFEKNCCQTLRANFHWEGLKERKKEDGSPLWKNKREMKKEIGWYHEPEPIIIEKDIKEVTKEEILKAAKLGVGECSIISGGFPCQGFSLAGKRMIEDPRNALYREFVRIVDEIKPVFIIGENVPGLASIAKGEIMKQICEDFANCGYDITWKILNAADYGVPQNRKRIFIIGKRIDMLRFPEKGNPAMHIAAYPGEIRHPDNWMEKYGAKLGIRKPGQTKLQ